jgi:hypothetical protein
MRLTWFAETTIRIHIGGRIMVADPDRAPAFVAPRELVSGADLTFALATDDTALAEIDPALWRPRRAARPLDEVSADREVHVVRMGPEAVLVDAPGEPPLALIAGSTAPRFGRWAEDAVIVLFGSGEALVALGTVLLDVAEPRLVALAADAAAVETAIAVLREHLDGTALVSLEPGMALEV